MVASHQLASLLVQHFPALEAELQPTCANAPVAQQLLYFAAYTRQVAFRGRLHELRDCLMLAGQLLQLPDRALAAAVEHIYLPALHLPDLPQDLQLLHQFMPAPLYQAYRQAC
jgi:hypothetical protein